MTTTSPQSSTSSSRLHWRIVDIIVAAVLGIACGLIFYAWDLVSGPLRDILKLAMPGLAGIVGGVWLLGGVLGGIIVRKPGAAIFVELVAAMVPALIGNQWGMTTLVSGLLQGLGAELVFLIFLYKKWNPPIAMLAGIGAAVLEWLFEIFVWYAGNTATFKVLYLVFLAISGAVLAGLLGWYIMKALARTGVLDRFASGRETRSRV
jgi:energy-coupling factor transport system substrate-specific component